MRTELPAKEEKLRELEAERDRKRSLIRDLLESRIKKNLEDKEKTRFLR